MRFAIEFLGRGEVRKWVRILFAICGILSNGTQLALLVPVLFASLLISTAQAQRVPGNEDAAASVAKPRVVPYRYRTHHGHAHTWGVDSLSVRSADSGAIIRFSYRVRDPEKAKALTDVNKNEPSLIDPEAGVKLILASLEQVGQAGQTALQAGEVHWMAFSNPGRQVKPGHRVDVIVGPLRADGLVVQ